MAVAAAGSQAWTPSHPVGPAPRPGLPRGWFFLYLGTAVVAAPRDPRDRGGARVSWALSDHSGQWKYGLAVDRAVAARPADLPRLQPQWPPEGPPTDFGEGSGVVLTSEQLYQGWLHKSVVIKSE